METAAIFRNKTQFRCPLHVLNPLLTLSNYTKPIKKLITLKTKFTSDYFNPTHRQQVC